MRLEGIFLPRSNLLAKTVRNRLEGRVAAERIDQVTDALRRIFHFVKDSKVPEPLRRIFAGCCCRIKNEVEPSHCLLEALIPAQLGGNQQRSVKEQLPVINGVSVSIEGHHLRRIRLQDETRVWIIIMFEHGIRTCATCYHKWLLRSKRQQCRNTTPVQVRNKVTHKVVVVTGKDVAPNIPRRTNGGAYVPNLLPVK